MGKGNSNGLGLAGFILALLALLGSWVPVVNWVLWFLGALFSFIGIFYLFLHILVQKSKAGFKCRDE